jgi:hypothetical protein
MKTLNTKQYGYQTLHRSRSEIRLIKLLPKDGDEKLQFIPACHIFHAALHASPKFVALSYVWGAATDPRLILVEGSPVPVNKNLYDAMMALRTPKEALVMWIDSLCVNQSDDEEKSWQVGLMADIYRQAYRVVAWLGPAESGSDSVMDYLNSFGAKAEAYGMHNGPKPFQEVWQKLALQRSVFPDVSRSKAMTRTPIGRTFTFS